MLRTRVAIPVVALYNAWQAEGLPTLHNALLAQVDFDDDQLAEGDVTVLADLARRGWAELERLGLARGRQVHADLGRSLRLIANASVEYYAFFNQADDDETRTALVVQSGDEALRVVLRADKHFVLEPVRVEDVVQSLVSALPEAKPGRGGVISLPADALSDKPRQPRPDEEGGSFLQASRPTGAHLAEVQQVRRLLAEQRTGGGQLYAARRDRFGRKQRCAAPLTYFDTITGRYLSAKTTGGHGTPWITVQPADFTTLQNRLRQLSADAAPRG